MPLKSSMKVRNSSLQVLLIILVSALVGVGVFSYTAGVEKRVKASQELDSLYIVSKQVLSGTKLGDAYNSGLIELKNFPVSSIPSGAVKTINSLNSTLVALQNLQPGQILLENSFGSETVKTGALAIPDGQIAVTITLPEPAHVASFIQPGSEVAIFATGQQSKLRITQVLLSKALVLAVGNQVKLNETQTSSNASSLITLSLTPQQSVKLIHAVQSLSLYIGLLGNSADLTEAIAISDASILG